MTDAEFGRLCNTYGFAPSRALRELIDCAIAQEPKPPLTDVKVTGVKYFPRKLSQEEMDAIGEPPCATRGCMPSECPNCVSLQDQNTELDRKLADLEQTSLELCNVCGWRTLIPGDCCLNCERHPLGQASTDVPLTVYSVKQAEPVAYSVGRTLHWHEGKGVNDAKLYLAPPQRKPMPIDQIYEMYNEPCSDAEMVEFARAIEQAHGIT